MKSSLTESHLLSVRVGFHSVALQAKFSCELVLELRVQGTSKVICETAGRPLIEGRCEVSQQLQLEWLASYDVGRSAYAQTLMEISVLARSVHGSILVGLVTFDVTRGHEQTVLPLRKCSDKSSTLCLSASHQFLQVVQEDREDSKQTPSSPDASHELKRMRSLSFIGKNQDSQLSISKIAVSNKRIENYLRAENEQLHRQIQINESKLKLAQRKEKEALFHLKETLLKHERANTRLSELERYQPTLQNALSDSEKKLRTMESDLKRERSIAKELQQKYSKLQKRAESREAVLNEQLKKVNQKVGTIQSQLQQSAQAYSVLLSQYEQLQTSNQAILKEREKMIAGERVRMNKELVEKETLLKEYQSQIQQFKQKMAEMQSLQETQRKNNQTEEILAKKIQALESVTAQNSSLKAKIQDLQEVVRQLRYTQEQKQPLRKRLNEILLENNSLQLQVDKVSINCRGLEAKNKQLLQAIENYSQQLKQQEAQSNETLNSNALLAGKKNELERENAHLKEREEKLAEMLKLEKEKSESRQNMYLRECEDNFRRAEVLQTEKARIEQQCSDLRWQIEKLESVNRELQNSHGLIKNQLFDMKQQIILNEEKYEQLQQQNIVLQCSVASKDNELRVQQAKSKDCFKSMDDKLSAIAKLEKERSTHQSEVSELKEQIQRLKSKLERCNQLQEKARNHYCQAKAQWQGERGELLNELSSKFEQLHQLKQELQKCSSNLKEVEEENKFLSSQNIQFTTELTHKEVQIKSFKQISSHETHELSSLRSLLAEKTEKLELMRASFQQYKRTNNDAIRWVLCLLGSSQLILEEETVFFPEQNLRELELEAVKNRNLFLAKQREALQSIREEKQFITTQLEKIGQEFLDSRSQFRQALDRERNEKDLEMRELIFEHSSIQNDLYESNLLREQLKDQNDIFFKQNKLMEHRLQECQAEAARMLEEKMESLSRLKESSMESEALKRELLELCHQNKRLNERVAQLQSQGTAEQASQLKDEIVSLTQRLLKHQAQLLQKQEKIRMFQEKTLILQSEKRKAEFAYNVSQELYRQLETKIEEINKAKTNLMIKNQALHSQIEKKENLIAQKEGQLSQIISQKAIAQQRLEIIEQNARELKSKLAQKEESLDGKCEELKDLKSKCKQSNEMHYKVKENLQLCISDLKGQLAICQLLVEQSASQLSSQERQIAALRKQLDQKKEAISKIEADHEMIQKEVFFEQSHKNTLSRDFEELSQNYQHAKSEIYVLEEEKLKLTQQQEELEQKLQTVQRSLEEALQNSRVRVVREVNELKKRLEQQQARTQKQVARCEELKNQMKQHESALQKKEFLILCGEQERERMRCDYEEEIQRLGLQLQKVQESHQEHFSEYKDEREHLLKQIEHLGQQCSQFNEIVRNLSEQLENSHKDHEKALRKIALLENEIRGMSPQKERSTKERTQMKGNCAINESSED